jgi:histidine phosphotransferase ChpT
MQLAQVVDGPELSLVAQSTCSANARLRFYRIAFGIVTADQAISQSEILSILNALQPHQKHRITWNCATNLTRQQAKLLFLLLMCLESTIPWGGEIEICTCKSGLQLVARAERYRMEHALWQAVQHGGRLEDVSPAKIHFALAGAEIRAQNCRVTLSDHVSCYVIDVALQ